MNRYETMGLVARSGKNKQLTNRLILTLTNSFAGELKARINDYDGDTYDFEFQQALELVNHNYEKFKDELFVAIKSLFTIRELKMLNISNEDSRNYDIAFKKLANHYNFILSKEKVFIPLTENAETVSNILNYVSMDFKEMSDPNLSKFHTARDKQRFVKDYNAISEMFIK